jgi:transcriptional regulator of arginine metabolism
MFMHNEVAESLPRFGVNKLDRHSAIRDLVAAAAMSNAAITNQDELRQRLAGRGFEVTQATLSRDIRDLHLVKGRDGYALANGGDDSDEDEMPSVADVLAGFGLRIRQAQNLLVLGTTLGGAQPVAAAIDQAGMPQVVGTIAGDDTVLLVCPDNKQASQLRELLARMIG